MKNKPRPGFEEEFAELEAIDNEFTEEQKKRWEEVSISPEETLGCLRVGYSEQANRYFLEQIVAEHREEAMERKAKGEDPEYASHWLQPDEVLLKEHHGTWLPDSVDYGMSTIQGIAAFVDLTLVFSFRGKLVNRNQLLPRELRGEAFEDMAPPQMADYAERMEKAALTSAAHQCIDAGMQPPEELFKGPDEAREWIERRRWEREEAAGSESFDRNAIEELAHDLRVVLDAARWLRFWADLGHAMWAWY